MARRVVRWASFLALVLLFGWAIPARAQGVITIESDVNVVYGEQLTFRAFVTTGQAIEQAILIVNVGRRDTQRWTAELIATDSGVEARVVLSPTQLDMPPTAPIRFTWEVVTVGGASTGSSEVFVGYEDGSLDWQEGTSNGVTVVVAANLSGQMIQTTVAQSLAVIQDATGEPAEGDLRLYVYPDLGSLERALALHGREAGGWYPGYVDPTVETVLVAASANLSQFESDLGYQLTRYTLASHAGTAFPTWYREGIALWLFAASDPTLNAQVGATSWEAWASLEELCAAEVDAMAPADRALVAGQSREVIEYIDEQYGRSQLRALYSAYAAGLTCNAGVELALGIPLAQLDGQWRSSPGASVLAATTSPNATGWLMMWAISLLLAGLFIAPRPAQGHQRPDVDFLIGPATGKHPTIDQT
ncbi:MAG: hypothetical protein GYB68_15150 [Chloroflexi bacterium]|nr:hypothetical protein [Chloroflexota bacterium]